MDDLISRQAAIDGVKTLHEVAWKNWHEPTLSANVVIDMIKDLPSAHPEVIHCKDCDLWHRTGCPMNVFAEKPEPGYFCGTAKRKEK